VTLLKNSLLKPDVARIVWTRLLFACVAVITLMTSYRVDQLSYSNFIQEVRTDTYLELLEVKEAFQSVVHSQSLVLRELATVLGENPDISQAEFSARVQNIRGVHESVVNIAAAPDLIISLVHPVDGNKKALGLDYRKDPEQGPEVQHILKSGTELMTGRINLAQGGSGMILRTPVYLSEDGAQNTNRRPWGIVSVVYDYEIFLKGVGILDAAARYDLLIQKVDPSGEGNGHFFGDEAVKEHNPVSLDFGFPFGNWQMLATPKGGWPEASPTQWRDRGALFLVSATLLTFLGYIISLSEARKRAKTLLTNGIAALNDGFVMFDANDRLLVSNERYRQLYDLPDELMRKGTTYLDILGESLKEKRSVIDAEGQVDWIERRKQARSAGAPLDIVQHFSNGKVIKVSDRPMSDGGYVGLRIDITELSHAKATAEAANRAKTDFIGVLGHELRTPLTVILGFAQLANNAKLLNSSKKVTAALEAGDKSPAEIKVLMDDMFTELTSMMDKVVQSGEHLLHLINEMLDVAKIEAGSLTLKPELCDIKDIVNPVSDQLRILSLKKGLEFIVTQEAGRIYVDRVRTKQILFNLVGNAIKFTEAGCVRLMVKVKPDHVIFEVHDSGIGISASELDYIFDTFYQVDTSATRGTGGTGMGLAIASNLAKMQGGRLAVTSEKGAGSCFKLILPSNKQSWLSREKSMAMAS